MRAVLVVLLLAINVGVRVTSRELRDEKVALQAELGRTSGTAEHDRAEAEARAHLEDISARFQQTVPTPPIVGLASLRESLLEAESGLELGRLSLEFRPLSGGGPIGALAGSRVQLSSRGAFDSLAAYLGRIEVSALPLGPGELRLRKQLDGSVMLDARWTAVWGVATHVALDAARLEAWLERERGATLTGELFGESYAPREAAARLEPPPFEDGPDVEEHPEPSPVQGPMPALTGFVLARPELEPNVARRVLAALRFEGAIHLKSLGERLGEYEVAAVEARESVTLVHAPTGERLVLYLP